MENIRNHRGIRIIVNERGMSRVVLESNHYTKKWFSGKPVAIKINKTEEKMNQPVSFYSRYHQDSNV